ncbi:MAG: glycosyltransferase family 39 protein [Planctomycetes bacterium]|nr:glycosyltransferase family 39 protein [Planctomycetota bacterium]
MIHGGNQGGAADEPVAAADRPARVVAHAFLAIAGVIYALTTLGYFQTPLLDGHEFRQCQTAITARYLADDLDPRRMLTYETPIMGTPWRVPFEFPLYQWLLAAVRLGSGLPIDQAGRLLTAAFHVACFWPMWRIVRLMGGTVTTWAILAGLFLISPVYHHWSRTVLIESTAVFLALQFLANYLEWMRSRRVGPLLLACVWAALAVLVKVTTFPAFAVAGVGLVARDAWLAWQGGESRRGIGLRLVAAALPFCLALAVLVPWLAACDAIKLQNPLAARTTSQALRGWNYGSLTLRVSGRLWRDTVLLRALPEAVGWPGMACIGFGLWWLGGPKRAVVAGLVALHFVPLLMFTNLHVMHNYYQCSSAIFLVAALAVVLAEGLTHLPRAGAVAVLGLVVLGCLMSSGGYLRSERLDWRQDPRYATALLIGSTVPDDEIIVVMGCDWSCEIAFYADRRAIYLPHWCSYDVVTRFLADPTFLSGGKTIGAFVIVNPGQYESWDNRSNEPLMAFANDLSGGRPPLQLGNCATFVRKGIPSRTPQQGANP